MTLAPDPGGLTAPGARDDAEWLRVAVSLAEWPTPVTRVAVPTSREPFEAWDAKPDKVRH